MKDDTNPKKRSKKRFDPEERGVYVGETSRSLYERTKEHLADAEKNAPDSHMVKHWEESHRGEEMPKFRFKIMKSYQDSLSRQVSEGVRIDLRKNVLNSKSVYSRNRLPRLEIEKPEWESAEEERRKKLLEWEKKESWRKEMEAKRRKRQGGVPRRMKT